MNIVAIRCGIGPPRADMAILSRSGFRGSDGMLGRCDRKREQEFGSAVRLGFNPDSPAVALHHLRADGQADPGPWNIPSVEPLEDAEDHLLVFRSDPNPVVANAEDPFALAMLCADVQARRTIRTIFEAVADEVLKKLRDLSFMAPDPRQGIERDRGPGFRDRRLQG